MIFLDPPYRPWVVGFLAAMSFFLVATWAKAYFQIIAQARTGLKLMDHPRIEITFDDSLITYASSTGTGLYQWNKMDRMAETKDFVILMSGDLPLLSLPKAAFSPEALVFMKGKLPSKLPSPKAGKLLILFTAVLGTTLVLLFGLLLYFWVVV